MWKRGGRSSALDRAQALLFAKRTRTGDAESVRGSTAKTRGAVDGSVKTRSAPPNTHTAFSDLSDLSSVSLAPEHGADTPGSAAAPAAGKTQGREGHFTKDVRPQSSLGGGRSRFLKKAPPPATNSTQAPVRKSQMQQALESRYVSPSQRGSQTAALSSLAQTEARQTAEDLTSDLGTSLQPAAQSPESSSDQSLKGRHFLKNKTAVAVNNSAAARSPKGPGAGVRSRAADAEVPSAGLKTKSVRLWSGVSLESDEEDMRKLLGDSLDSTDDNFLTPGRPSSIRTADKVLSQSSQKVHATPPPAAPPRSPASPPHHGSPVRFTGPSRANFSPSTLSPSTSPPCVPPSPRRRWNSPLKVVSPQRSLSSMSRCSEVLSLEELFPVGPGSEGPDSEMSAVSSEDFKINVISLDDLAPAALGFTEETPGKEREAKHSAPVPGSPNRSRQLPRSKEEMGEEQQEEGVSKMEPDYSARQISEYLQGDGDEGESVSEVSEVASDSDVSHGRTEDDYSSTFSDISASRTSRTSERSQALSRSRSLVSHGSRTSSQQSRRRASSRKVLKEAAVQTQPEPLAYTRPAGMATLGPAVGLTYMAPTPVVARPLSAEMVEALSTFDPGAFVLNEMLKQQLSMTRQFIESSRHLHSSLVQSLEPPNYRYTTLEDTKEFIRKHRPPKLTMEKALEEVLQEMRDHHHM